MPDSIGKQIAQGVLAQQKPSKAAAPIFNTGYTQKFEGLPVSNPTLSSGVLEDLAYSTEGYGTQIGKHIGAALVNTAGFAASTLAAIPNLIDNAFNDGNDRIAKPIADIQTDALKNFSMHQNPGEQGVLESLLPSWYTGNTHSFWGDVIEQSGIIAGTTIGTGALLKGLSLIPGTTAAGNAVANVVKNTLTKAISPSTLLGEGLATSKGILNTVNSQKFVNGLATAAKTQGINAVQAYTEALFEGLDGERSFIESKKQEHYDKFGEEPTGVALKEIEQNAKELKNARFGLNMVGLMISNTPFTKAFFGGEANTIWNKINKMGKTLDADGKLVTKEIEAFKNLPKYLKKPANFIGTRMPLAWSEGIEEVYQLGVEKGLDNYYSNKLESKDFQANFHNIAKSIGVGLDEGVFSKEGLQSFITGAGVGSVFQIGTNIVESKKFDKFLNTTTQEFDSATKTFKNITQAESIANTSKGINSAVQEIASTALNADNVGLGQTFADRMQQFITDNNNMEDAVKVEGSFLEFDQAQRTKFDSLFPYVKKGYKELIQARIEGAFEQIKQENPNMSEKELQTLEANKTQALADLNTVEQFHETVNNVFPENYADPDLQKVNESLKDLAAYHLWNIHSLDKQNKEIEQEYGQSLFTDEFLAKYKGDNVDEILSKEIAAVTLKEGELDLFAEKRKELEKIQNAEDKQSAYMEYKQKDRPGIKLSSEDYLTIKQGKEKVLERVNTNNQVILNLNNLKNNPIAASRFLQKYIFDANNIVGQTSEEAARIELRAKNISKIFDEVGQDLELAKQVKEMLGEELDNPELSPLRIKQIIEEIKKGKKPEEKPKGFQTLNEALADLESRKKAQLAELQDLSKLKTGDTVWNSLGEEGEIEMIGSTGRVKNITMVPFGNIKPEDAFSANPVEILKKYDEEAKAFEEFFSKKDLAKVIADNTNLISSAVKGDKQLISDVIKALGDKMNSPLSQEDIDAEVQKLINKNPAKSYFVSPVLSKIFSKVLSYLSVDSTGKFINNAVHSRTTIPLPTVDNIGIDPVLLPAGSNNLKHDVGLVREQDGKFPILQITIDNNRVFTIQSNQDNLLIDLVLLKQLTAQIKEEYRKTEKTPNPNKDFLQTFIVLENFLKEKNKNKETSVSFLNLLESVQGSVFRDTVFKTLQTFTFESRTPIKTADEVLPAGRVGVLFNFKGMTLEGLIDHLSVENELYDELLQVIASGDKQALFDLITEELYLDYKDSEILENADPKEFNIPIKDSGAVKNGVVFVQNSVLEGVTAKGAIINGQIAPDITQGIEVLLANNPGKFADGYYAVFMDKSGNPHLRNIRTSLPFANVEQEDNFKVQFTYTSGKATKDFYNDVFVKGTTYKMTDKLGAVLYEGEKDGLLEAIEKQRNNISASITFLKNGTSRYSDLYEHGLTNSYVVKDAYIEVSPRGTRVKQVFAKRTYASSTNVLVLGAKPPAAPSPGSLQSGNQPITPQPPVGTSTSLEVTKGKISFSMEFTNHRNPTTNTFMNIKSGVTQEEIQEFAKNFTKRGKIALEVAILDNFYEDGNPIPFSTISQFQLDKIKEFTKTCQ